MVGFLFLQETNVRYTQRPDIGRNIVSTIRRIFNTTFSQRVESSYEMIESDEVQHSPPLPCSTRSDSEDNQVELQMLDRSPGKVDVPEAPRQSSKPRTHCTHQVILQILSVSLLAFHKVASDTLIPVFLASASSEFETQRAKRSFLNFGGGFGMDTATIGNVLLTQAVVAIVAQLFAVPYIIERFGALRTYRWTAFVFPWMYFLTPFVVKLPSPLSVIALLLDLWVKVLLVALGYVCSAIL